LNSELTNQTTDQEQNFGILLVDDEPHILTALVRSLRRYKWRLFSAPSGEEGLEILEREQIHVVISDYRMDGMDGVTFLRLVKEKWPDIQRVMLTGQASFEAVEKAINESEVHRFLNKPWLDAQLAATVNECLDHIELIVSNRLFETELAKRNQELSAMNLELEKKVEERTQALIQAEKMVALGRMAGGVAHEINNPLGGILAFVQVLLRESRHHEDEPTKEALETIQSCALRCKDIVENLLSFSRKSSGEAHTEVDLNNVARNSLAIAQLDPRANDVSVRLELGLDVPLVLGRSGLLEQVVINLLQNAFYASASGSKVVLRTEGRGNQAVLVVQDEGTGIAAQVLAHIFEPFFTTKETGEGTGLGLSICYGIAQEHGGSLIVESKESEGSKFELRLPAADCLSDKELRE